MYVLQTLVKRLDVAAQTGELVNIHRLFCDLAMVRLRSP